MAVAVQPQLRHSLPGSRPPSGRPHPGRVVQVAMPPQGGAHGSAVHGSRPVSPLLTLRRVIKDDV